MYANILIAGPVDAGLRQPTRRDENRCARHAHAAGHHRMPTRPAQALRRAGAQLQFLDYANWRDERVAARRTSPRLGSFSKAETAAPTRAPKAKDRVTQTISAGIIQSTKEIMKPPSSPQVLLDICLLFRAEGWHFGAEIEKPAPRC